MTEQTSNSSNPLGFLTSKTSLFLGVGLLVLFVGVWIYMAKFNINKEVGQVRNKYNAQLKVNENSFNTVWTIIKNEAKVPDKYKDAIKEVLVANNSSKYGADGVQITGFMSVLQEANPNFNNEMYVKLMNLIEAELKAFQRDQNTLIAISQEYNDLLLTWSAQTFVSDLTPIDPKIVTSTKTKKAFETGVNDDDDIFAEKEAPKKDTSSTNK